MHAKKILLYVLVFLITVNVVAVNMGYDREVREVERFYSISATSGLDVYITQEKEQRVEIEASNDQMHRIVAEVKNGILHVYVKGSFRWNAKDVRKVYISAPEYRSIAASGGADIHSSAVLKGEELVVKSNGGADVYLSVDVKSLSLHCSGGADMLMEGTTEQLTASASGGADINAKKLKAKHVTASASGGGHVDVFASESLSAKASSGADINYLGSPKNKDISKSSGGDVSGY